MPTSGKFDAARHPRDRFGRFTKSRTVKATAKDKAAAKAVAAGFAPKQIGDADREAYLRRVAGGRKASLADLPATNKALRAGDEAAPGVGETDKTLVVLPDDVLLSRQVPAAVFGSTAPESLQGMKVRDAGFAAAQLGTVAAADGQVRMHIAVPAGHRAAVDPVTGEVVLDRDTEMVVSRVQPNGSGGHDMYLTVLPKLADETAPTAGDDTPQGGELVRADLMKLRVAELQAQMRERGLKPGRKRKSELVDALVADEIGDTRQPVHGHANTTLEAVPESKPSSLDDRIRSVVRELSSGHALARLDEVRDRFPDVDRVDLDAALRRLARQPDVYTTPDPDRMHMTSKARRSAIDIGGQDQHLIAIVDRQPAAAPKPSSKPKPAKGVASGQDALDAAPLGLSQFPPPPDLTWKMTRALHDYQVHGFTDVNTRLRQGEPAPATDPVGKQISAIDAAMQASPLVRDVRVYRGLGDARSMFGSRLDGDLTGMVWREDAYLSTTAEQQLGRRFAADDDAGTPMLMHVTVPAGTGAVELSGTGYEAELLVDRGHDVRVVQDLGLRGGMRVVEVEVLPRAKG